MIKPNPALLVLIGSITVIGLTGCEQVEQAANDAVEKAKQSAVQVLDEARQSGSIDQTRQSADQAIQDARQTADQVLLEARQKAAGLLGKASEYLATDPQQRDTGIRTGETPAADL